MIKGAIFDFDGTLVDSMFIWDTIGEVYLRSLGKEPKENLAETFKTFTLEQSAEYYREHYGVMLPVRKIIDDVNATVAQIYHTQVTLKDGAKEFLEKLRVDGVKMCVATVTDKPIVEYVLEKLGILPDQIDNAGKAALILDRLAKRREEGLTTPKQIRLLERYGFQRVGEWTFERAKRLIDGIAANGWRVPKGIVPSEFKPVEVR